MSPNTTPRAARITRRLLGAAPSAAYAAAVVLIKGPKGLCGNARRDGRARGLIGGMWDGVRIHTRIHAAQHCDQCIADLRNNKVNSEAAPSTRGGPVRQPQEESLAGGQLVNIDVFIGP